MPDSPGLLDLPQRLTLSAQAAAALRKAIAAGIWHDLLPSERRLCALLQVSRPTVRSALRTLAGEGIVEVGPRQPARLRRRPRAPAPAPRHLVALVSHQPLSRLTLTAYQGISEMRAQLARHGFTLQEFVCRGRSPATQRRQLEAFVRESGAAGSVLVSVSRGVQEWFAARRLPALVLGSCHAAVSLPSLDVDYRAVCRHAAGRLLRAGHRRLALLVPDLGVAGDLASEAGFLEGVARHPGTSALVVRHGAAAGDLTARLSALLRTPAAPTALLVARPVHTVTVLVALLRLGLRVPARLSLIARDHDPVYAGTVDHYAFGNDAFAHRLSRLMLQLVAQGRLPAEPSLIFPHYVAGGTVQPPPAA
jgi:DNA-binding LacI/PurR family transcriptional regulator